MTLETIINREKNYQRVSRTATIRLNAVVREVFPLFGPVREKDWAFGWQPEIVYTLSALVEEKMIFRTSGVDGDYTWVVTKYQPENYTVEYCVHTANRIWFITVSCMPEGAGTLAIVTYTFTSLTSEGAELNQRALQEMFACELKDWEEAINHYLLTGQLLQPHQQITNTQQ